MRVYNPDFPEDIRVLRATVPELKGKTDFEIDNLYSTWSNDVYSAGWIAGPDVEGFKAWLADPMGGATLV